MYRPTYSRPTINCIGSEDEKMQNKSEDEDEKAESIVEVVVDLVLIWTPYPR